MTQRRMIQRNTLWRKLADAVKLRELMLCSYRAPDHILNASKLDAMSVKQPKTNREPSLGSHARHTDALNAIFSCVPFVWACGSAFLQGVLSALVELFRSKGQHVFFFLGRVCRSGDERWTEPYTSDASSLQDLWIVRCNAVPSQPVSALEVFSVCVWSAVVLEFPHSARGADRMEFTSEFLCFVSSLPR